MLINLSNHPSTKWDKSQLDAATQFGEIRDISFPNISPDWDVAQVKELACDYFKQIKSMAKGWKEKPVIHISGEPVFCFLLIQMLLKEKFSCITSTTERIVREDGNTKTTIFEFKQFRKYEEMKKKSIIKRLGEWYKKFKNLLPSDDKLRYKSLIVWTISELSLLFLANLFVNFELISAIKKVCHFPDLASNEKTVLVISLILVLLLFAGIFTLCRQLRTMEKHGFSFNTLIVTKLLASVIQPRLINITYLSVFVLHVACLGNAIFALLAGNSFSVIILNIGIIICILGGCFYLVYTFPYSKTKERNGHNVFFSGIPMISLSPNNRDPYIEGLNLYPVVRAFCVLAIRRENIVLKEGDKMCILLSKDLTDRYVKGIIEKAKSAVYEGKNGSQEAVQWFNDSISKIEVENVEETIGDFIKIFAKYAFYENKELCKTIDGIEINFSPSVNYNDFENCYQKAKNSLDSYEKEGYDIIVNCSPGTTTLSAALTILSMESNRRLLYYSQNEKVEIENKMIEIMDNKLHFKDIIEKISEELSNQS
jgi:hypothetical protein